MTHKLTDNTYEQANLRILFCLVVFALLSLLYVVSFLVFETSQVNGPFANFGPQVVAAQTFLQAGNGPTTKGDIAEGVFDYVARLTSGNNTYVNNLSNGQLANGFSNVITRPVVTTMEYGMSVGSTPPTNIMNDWTNNVYGMASTIANMTKQVKQQGGIKTLIGTKGVPSYYEPNYAGVNDTPKYIRGVAKQAMKGTGFGDAVVNGTGNTINLVNKAMPAVRNASQLSSKFTYESMLGLKTARNEFAYHITPIIEARKNNARAAAQAGEGEDVLEGEQTPPVRDTEEKDDVAPANTKGKHNRKATTESTASSADTPPSLPVYKDHRDSGYPPGSMGDLMYRNMVNYLDQGVEQTDEVMSDDTVMSGFVDQGGRVPRRAPREKPVREKPTKLPRDKPTSMPRERPTKQPRARPTKKPRTPIDYSKMDYSSGTVVIDPSTMDDRSKMFPAMNRLNDRVKERKEAGEERRDKYRQLDAVDSPYITASTEASNSPYLQDLMSLGGTVRSIGVQVPPSTDDIPFVMIGKPNMQGVPWRTRIDEEEDNAMVSDDGAVGVEPTQSESVTIVVYGPELTDAPTTTNSPPTTYIPVTTDTPLSTDIPPSMDDTIPHGTDDMGAFVVPADIFGAVATYPTMVPFIPGFFTQPALPSRESTVPSEDGIVYISPEDVYADRIADALRDQTLEEANNRINTTDIYRALAAGTIDEPAAYSGLVALLTNDLDNNMFRVAASANTVMEFLRSVYTTRAGLAVFLGPQMGDQLLYEIFRSAINLSNTVSQQEEKENAPVNAFFPIGEELLNDYQEVINEFVKKINNS